MSKTKKPSNHFPAISACCEHEVTSQASDKNSSWKNQEQMEWEKIPKPAAPKNLNDLAEMARYDEAMDRYMAQTTEMRARDAQRWRTTQKKR